MTAYVTHESAGTCCFWATDLDEAVMLAAAVGNDLSSLVRDAFPRLMVTGTERLALMALGVKPVDWLEPKYQWAAMTGDIEGIQAVETYRAKWGR